MDPYTQPTGKQSTGKQQTGSDINFDTPDQLVPQQPPSIDGFLAPAQRPHRTNRPAIASAPSQSAHPFQPAGFYRPPPQPNLPIIDAAPPRRVETPPKRRQGLQDLLSVGGVLASALLLAFGLINFVFQSYQVEGQSMRATLEDKDHLIVWKVDKTISNITNNAYIPNRGDVIIFNEPPGALLGGPKDKQLIKRVLALPGERIVMKGTAVMVYNKDKPDGFNPDETLPYGDVIVNQEGASNIDVTIGDGEVFVGGDNRDNSSDSRVFGPLDTDQIVGKLVVRILPLNTFKLF